MTQQKTVERHLKDFGHITTWIAFTDYGVTRLSQYIMLLRKEGMNIHSEPTSKTNRYGKPVNFVTYQLVKEEKQGVLFVN